MCRQSYSSEPTGAYSSFEHVLIGQDPDIETEIQLDIRDLPTIKPQQFDAVYCFHKLEHVHQQDVPLVLAGFRHVLKPGGLAHIIAFDLQAVMLLCLQQGIDLDGVLDQSPMGPITPLDVLYGYGEIMGEYGWHRNTHRTGFSRRTLANAIASSGFGPMFCQQNKLELNLIAFNGNPDPELAALFDLPFDTPKPAAS
jgi:ubiquinone/menaquinone biosynthesis C-methylase UbiE